MILRTKLYTFDANLMNSDGIYSPHDWSSTRRSAELAAVYKSPTDENYQIAVTARPDKVKLTKALCDVIDFSKYSDVGEIGGAPYIQASLIKTTARHLNYIATDHDAQTNSVLQKVPMLRSLEIKTFSARSGDYTMFDTCQLILSFAVDYALTDNDIARLLAYLSSSGKSWAMLSVSVADFPRFVRLKLGFVWRTLLRRPQRFHGWARSVDYYRRAARNAGMTVREREPIGGYRFLWFSPAPKTYN